MSCEANVSFMKGGNGPGPCPPGASVWVVVVAIRHSSAFCYSPSSRWPARVQAPAGTQYRRPCDSNDGWPLLDSRLRGNDAFGWRSAAEQSKSEQQQQRDQQRENAE